MSFLSSPPSGHGLLARASPDLRGFLDHLAQPISLADGTILFEQGSQGCNLYFLTEGAIDVSILTVDGRRLALNRVMPGELLGEISFFSNGNRSATAVAHGPCRTLSIDRETFFRGIAKEPHVAVELLAHLGSRLAWLSERQVEQTLYAVDARLARRLLYLASRNASGFDDVGLTQSQLAEHLGVSREKVSRILSGWRDMGWVETRRACIAILDRASLSALSDVQT